MQVEYRTNKIRKVCTDASEASRKYGDDMAEKIQQRISEIEAADSIEQMMRYHIGGCHKLEGNRKDQYAVYLVHPQRLIFKMNGSKIQIANIIEIADYH